MTSGKESGEIGRVEDYIAEREPVAQDEVEEEFGRQGLVALRKLMLQNRVSYTLYWDLQTESGPDGR